MVKKIVILATLCVSMALFAFKPTKTNVTYTCSSAVTKDGDNYIMEDIEFTTEDEAAFAVLAAEAQDIQDWYETNGATDFFLIRCYSDGPNKFTHGSFCGGGCCTTPKPTEPQPSEAIKNQMDDIQSRIDAIMTKYQ